MPQTFTVALAQIGSRLGNVGKNEAKHLEYLERAKKIGAAFVVFPELSLTGYMLRDLAYEVAPECSKALKRIARASKNIYTILGLVDEPRLGIYQNAAALLHNGKVLGVVSKSYLPSYGLFEEKRYFKEAGPKNVKVFNTKYAKIGITICEDVWHPEPCEALARLGADVIFCISSSPIRGFYGSKGKTVVERAWEKILGARAIENTVYLVFVNKAGAEDEEYFWGGSSVIAPDGVEIVKAKHLDEDFVVGEIDLNRLVRVRRFSSFRDHHKGLHELLGRL